MISDSIADNPRLWLYDLVYGMSLISIVIFVTLRCVILAKVCMFIISVSRNDKQLTYSEQTINAPLSSFNLYIVSLLRLLRIDINIVLHRPSVNFKKNVLTGRNETPDKPVTRWWESRLSVGYGRSLLCSSLVLSSLKTCSQIILNYVYEFLILWTVLQYLCLSFIYKVLSYLIWLFSCMTFLSHLHVYQPFDFISNILVCQFVNRWHIVGVDACFKSTTWSAL